MSKKIDIYMTTIQYPCGEGSSCCGPVGQKTEDIIDLKNAIEEHYDCSINIVNIGNEKIMKDHKQIVKYISMFGLGVLPFITVDDDIVSMGTVIKSEVLDLLASCKKL